MVDTFLNVLSIIGIVIAAAFVIAFLSDLFISIVDGTNGIFFRRHKNRDDDYDDRPVKRPIMLNEPKEYKKETVKELTLDQSRKEENVSYEETTRKNLATTKKVVEEEEEREVDIAKAQREEELAKSANNRQNIVDQRSQQKTIITPAPVVTPQPIVKETEEDIDKIIAEISKETLKEIEKQNELNKSLAEKEQAKNREKELQAQIEELKSQIAKDKNTIKSLEDKINNQEVKTEVKTEVVTVKVPTGDREDIENRLAILRERLKENEKELAVNKKEYIPLRRVNNTLESDKKKLRRREAIVAKQKVVLYGVNNYVDIDEEKAKKLSEELDLLEGLRLSVQHCEEVMQKNKDRYPILERANKFLTKNNAQLKEDIAKLEAQLKELEENEK